MLLPNDQQPLSPCPEIQLHPMSLPIMKTPRNIGLHLYFPTVQLGKHLGEPKIESPPKCAQIHPPSHSPPPNVSKNTLQNSNKPCKSWGKKQELNKAVKAGTFKCNTNKWAKFKQKILDIDLHLEVNDTNAKRAWDVLHVRCGKVICMATVYDVNLYKHHVQSCKSHTTRVGMHTLDQGLSFIFL